MNFVSLTYALFLIAVLVVYWRLPRKGQHLLLLIASYFFYACWDWRFLGLIVLTSSIDYLVGGRIFQSNKVTQRKLWLGLSLVINLGILGYFKYANFFIESFIDLLTTAGIDTHLGTLSIILPVGISFYTFQSISYSIDIYRRELEPADNLLDFLTFVAFFPQLVAGPIVRAKEFLYQMAAPRIFKTEYIIEGVQRILTGIVKKAVVADTLAMQLVDPVFASPDAYSTSMLWIAAIAYAVQIYCDFSGYTNIAIGSARLFGFSLPENFRFPYLANSFSDFWLRWHMTMSRFFRDYVYIPLGGNRKSPPRNLANLASTTLVSGLWHGAAWHFVLWGGAHGILLVIQRLIPLSIKRYTPQIVTIIAVQVCILITWVLFRAPDMGLAWSYIAGMLTNQSGETLVVSSMAWLCFGLFTIDHIYGGNAKAYQQQLQKPMIRALFWLGLIGIAHNCMPTGANPFIYFQF